MIAHDLRALATEVGIAPSELRRLIHEEIDEARRGSVGEIRCECGTCGACYQRRARKRQNGDAHAIEVGR